jgi:hypothetical protein
MLCEYERLVCCFLASMLALPQLKGVFALASALGARQYGHVDHDAHAMTGPHPSESEIARPASKPQKGELHRFRFAKCMDSASGTARVRLITVS